MSIFRFSKVNRAVYTFGDALRQQGPRVFTTLVKPGGSSCNLACSYCYYLDKAKLYGNKEPVMDDALLESYIRQYIEACQTDTVTFCWHGGEPLLLGVGYYKRAVNFQQRYAGSKRIENTLQTNGLLLNEAWCDFFAEHDFLLGLSIDGPSAIHDAYRLHRNKRGSLDKVLAAADLMHRRQVKFNTLSVVSRLSEERGGEVYRFLRDSVGSRFMQFLPAVDWLEDGSPAPWTLSPDGFGKFLCAVFDEWVRHDISYCYVQLFESVLALYCGLPSGVCTLSETCGEGLAVEHNGDVYPCDHFVSPEHLLGNLKETSLAQLFDTKERLAFALAKRNGLSAECYACTYYPICHGGCPGHRREGKNCLCPGMKSFFRHAAPAMLQMKALLSANRSPAELMREENLLSGHF